MRVIQEFEEFAHARQRCRHGTGIVIGAAFGKIVSSRVNDVIMPPIGLVLGNVDFSNLVVVLRGKTANSGAVTLKYGLLVNNISDFVIVAFAIFVVIKQMNRFRRKAEVAPTTKDCPIGYFDQGDPLSALHLGHIGRRMVARF